MRRILLSLIFALLVMSAPALADTTATGQCSLDSAVTSNGVSFPQCPLEDVNNGLIAAGFPGARLNPDDSLSATPIFTHDVCKYVDARGISGATFIPFSTDAEWAAFLANLPTGVHTAECCLPRPLNRSDVPTPSETCSTGWNFIALVDPNDSAHVLATVGANGDFVLANGVSNDPSYPITKLPIERGDIGALVPAQAASAYVGKFHCDGTVDFGSSNSPVGLTSTTSSNSNSFNKVVNLTNGQVVSSTATSSSSTGTSTGTASTATNVDKLMGFNMQCVNDHWAHTSPSCFGKTVGIQTQACPNNAPGVITLAVIQECDGSTQTQQISNTCSQVCPARQITEEQRPCPAGQTGVVNIEVIKLCSGTQPVTAGDQATDSCFCESSETEKSRTCETCVPSTDKGDQTQACPNGQDGHVIVHTTHICTIQNNQCVCHDEQTVKENTCHQICPPTTTTTVTEPCPAGQVGAITIERTTTCHASCECGGAQCVCHDEDKVICNTCVPACTPSSHATTEQCPAGQTGSIITTVTHVCPDNRDVTSVQNTCVPVCTPASHSTTGQCPVGFVGSITTTVTHVCPDNRDVTSVQNNCVFVVCPTCTFGDSGGGDGGGDSGDGGEGGGGDGGEGGGGDGGEGGGGGGGDGGGGDGGA